MKAWSYGTTPATLPGMVKAVFIESSHSPYRDDPGRAYHFPNMYLSRVEETVGDWVIFYEGRRGDGKGYHRVQQVREIIPDPDRSDHSFALLEPATELDFETRLARARPDGTLWESRLARMGGNNTSAVRLLSDRDFAAIIEAGLSHEASADAMPREPAAPPAPGLAEDAAAFIPYLMEDRTRILTSRALRDAAFARNVRRAYHGRCAISGLELRNGGGRPEVEAAHIRPVEQAGPDTIRNGMALTGTLHWMFDRGLLGVGPDQTILIARNAVDGDVAARLINPTGRLILPKDGGAAPHPAYLDWHRANVFKG